MKISEIFHLGKEQPELDFVNIDITEDKPLFIDPYFIGTRNDPWCIKASDTIRNYFQTLVTLIKQNDPQAWNLFQNIGEPNETCLGLSQGKPQGRGVGSKDAKNLYKSFGKSKAIQTGLVQDLEDSRIFVDKVGVDKVSDMTTAIIRKLLVEYTKEQAQINGISLQSGIATGWYWDSTKGIWQNQYDDMLVIDRKKYLLVPKGIVSCTEEYSSHKYYDLALDYFQNNIRSVNPILVQQRAGRPHVTKRALRSEYPYSKEFLQQFSEDHPEIFKTFKQNTKKNCAYVLDDEIDTCDIPRLAQSLIKQLQSIPSGTEHAIKYQRLIAGIYEFIFYPLLQHPRYESKINDGRKRIDIYFDRANEPGIFANIAETHDIFCPYISVECKNYSQDIANAELDQTIGRFSDTRGRLGIIACRSIYNMETFIARCRDTLRDGHGLIIPLVDTDLIAILSDIITQNKKNSGLDRRDNILRDRCRSIVLG